MIGAPETTPCINCGKENGGQFCRDCGQKLQVPRLNTKSFLGDIVSKILGLEGMLPRTMADLTMRPGNVIQQYILGNRKRYVGPISYYFLMFGVYLLLLSLLDIDLAEMVNAKGMQDSMQQATGSGQPSDQALKAQEAIQAKLFKNIQFLALLQFPFVAWWARLFFRKSGYNFLEHIVLPFYVFGQLTILSLLYGIVYKISGFFSLGLGLVVTVIYFSWSGVSFYKPSNKFIGVLKMLVIYLLSYLCFLLLATLVGAVVGIIIGYARA